MDPAEVAKIWEFLDRETDRRLGPRSPGYDEFLSTLSPVDASPFLRPGTHLVDHYRLRGTTMTAYNRPGLFEASKMSLDPRDVLLASYPKTGTTWLSEIAYLVMNDADVDWIKGVPIDHRIPYLEWPGCTLDVLCRMPSPRFIKTHRPYHWMPDGGCDRQYKIVYIARNPKDTVVSFYHFCKTYKLVQFAGELRDFLNLFLNDIIAFTPYEKHVLGYWEHRHDPNVHFVLYEDLQRDTEGEVRKLARFLEKDLTDEQIKTILNATSFTTMERNADSNHGQFTKSGIADKNFKFMRKGQVGDWKNHFDDDTNKAFDEWIEQRFGSTDLRFRYA